MEEQKFRCCLCGEMITGEWGNNPAPIASPMNKCCDKCNMEKVIPERLKRLFN